ncbi:MAG: hypothetical protein IKN49_02555 [Elusimicrobiaceae bacterium]|nr:hypothetical protein [Elusimicrobiaceae bacterium]
MKKLIALLVVIGAFPLLTQAQKYKDPPAVENLKNSILKSAYNAVPRVEEPNAGSIEQNKVVHFSVKEQVSDDNFMHGTFEADIFCKAYPLDAHWLVVADTCLNVSDEDIFSEGDHNSIQRQRVEESLKDMGTRSIYRNGNLMLIRLNEETYTAPYVHLLAVDSPATLFALGRINEIKINTSRFAAFKDHIRSRKFKKNSADGNFFQLDEGMLDLSGTATDPLFMIADKENHEVLAAYNQGKISYALQISANDTFHTSTTLTSPDWKILTKNDLEFVKQTISKQEPAAWEQVKKRLFFNNTRKPFFD